ncbi:SCAN domain-containing protein 3 [Merluccius polli]|uniref:SCAN domain-containing protein 3 n=1 Tax=Merluccius polli TaxID=89951 RepID=A0AA47P5V0_MERPO|nr:SCAN domain-containing protein 3 [Merluccius polli]
MKRKSTYGLSVSKKKTRQYLQSYLDFGFIEGQDSFQPECIICGEKLANDNMKPSKLKRHHQTIGGSREYFERKKQLALSRRSTDLIIAKAKKPHNIGEQLIKPACLKIVDRLCGPHVADEVKTVPLSDNTVKDRIDKMAADCQNQLHEKLRNVNFAIQLDEQQQQPARIYLCMWTHISHPTICPMKTWSHVALTGPQQ